MRQPLSTSLLSRPTHILVQDRNSLPHLGEVDPWLLTVFRFFLEMYTCVRLTQVRIAILFEIDFIHTTRPHHDEVSVLRAYFVLRPEPWFR
jgi:hypothetical protein